MPRPTRCRRICSVPACSGLIPRGHGVEDDASPLFLTLDEYEVIRLVDHMGMTHAQCAAQMEISRTTATEIYQSARMKLAACLVQGRPLVIGGGNYRLCDGAAPCPCHGVCYKQATPHFPKGEVQMRIAVTYENGAIFQHFGRTSQFKVYDVKDGQITSTQVVGTGGQGHGALAGVLHDLAADVLICGGIGGGAQMALAQAGIQLYGGVSGDADQAVAAFLAGSLDYQPDVHCDHHGHDHGHTCGHHDHQGCGGTGGSCV